MLELICCTIKGGVIINLKKASKIAIIAALFILIITVIVVIKIKFFNTNEKIEVAEVEATEEVISNRESNVTSRSGEERAKKENIEESNTSEEKQEEEKKYTNIKDIKISKNMNLTVRTGLSKEDFKKLIGRVKADKTKFFYNNSEYIYDLCEKYELNEIFFCGLIAGESGWNITSNHRNTHNYISLMSGGKLKKFSSTKAGLEAAAKTLHKNYLTKGGKFYSGKTLAGVKKRFCPASSTWTNLIYGCMKEIVKYK